MIIDFRDDWRKMEIYKLCKLNLKEVKKTGLAIASSLFAILSIILSFLSWDDIGIKSLKIKLLILIGILFSSVVIAVLVVCYCRKYNIFYENGSGKIIICYGDLMKLAFPKKKKRFKIVVIPVNTSFDMIVDKDITEYENPLISPKTIHGMWVENMMKEGNDLEQLNQEISKHLQNRTIMHKLTRQEKRRGRLDCFEIGTIVPISGKKNITYLLTALSEFDENNNARSKKNEVIRCIESIIDYCDVYGQGYELYLPLLGSGLSRANLSHEESLQTIEAVLQLHNEKIHGEINVVIYHKDKTKVSIF